MRKLTLLQPEPLTKEGFATLLMDVIDGRNYPSGAGFAKNAAIESKTSPTCIGLMIKGQFPEAPVQGESSLRKRKRIEGAIASLTRVCDTFGFDLDACLEACDLPYDQLVISQVRKRREVLDRREVILGADALEMLLGLVPELGPIPLVLIPTLLELWERKRALTEK